MLAEGRERSAVGCRVEGFNATAKPFEDACREHQPPATCQYLGELKRELIRRYSSGSQTELYCLWSPDQSSSGEGSGQVEATVPHQARRGHDGREMSQEKQSEAQSGVLPEPAGSPTATCHPVNIPKASNRCGASWQFDFALTVAWDDERMSSSPRRRHYRRRHGGAVRERAS